MPACPREKEYSSSSLSSSTTLNENETSKKQNQLIDALTKLAEKYRLDQTLVEQQSKQTELLSLITNYALSSPLVSIDDRRNFLQRIISTSQDLLSECEQMESPSSISIPITNDDDSNFSLNDLAKEFLQSEISPVENATPSSQINECNLTSNIDRSESIVLSAIVLPSSNKSPLDSILFSNCLSSQVAADDAETIWKDTSSSFGQIFCHKLTKIPIETTKRSSTCLLDRSLYERLTRLIELLPKQCPINSAPSMAMRTTKPSNHNNGRQSVREHRPNPGRPNFRSDFAPQMQSEHPRQRHPHPRHAGSFQTYANSNYSMNYNYESHGYHQTSNRYAHPRAPMPNPNDYYYPQHDPRPRQPNRKNTFENQQQQQQGRRGPKNNNSGGPKFSQDKSGPPRSAPPPK